MAAKRLYPWNEWFSRQRFSLRSGSDYKCSSLSMAQQVRNFASSIGLRVRITEDRRGLSITVMLPRTSNKAS